VLRRKSASEVVIEPAHRDDLNRQIAVRPGIGGQRKNAAALPVGQLYIGGVPKGEIAATLDCSRQTVTRDVKWLKKLWVRELIKEALASGLVWTLAEVFGILTKKGATT